MSVADLPAVNASLNAAAACCLTLGWIFIRAKNVNAHRAAMLTAFAFSTLFLGCYLVYHAYEGSRSFPGTGVWRAVYFAVLVPHIILAVVMLPGIFWTFALAFRGEFERHRRIARVTLPVWLYVSVTGVVVYWMLYRVEWS